MICFTKQKLNAIDKETVMSGDTDSDALQKELAALNAQNDENDEMFIRLCGKHKGILSKESLVVLSPSKNASDPHCATGHLKKTFKILFL